MLQKAKMAYAKDMCISSSSLGEGMAASGQGEARRDLGEAGCRAGGAHRAGEAGSWNWQDEFNPFAQMCISSQCGPKLNLPKPCGDVGFMFACQVLYLFHAVQGAQGPRKLFQDT